jgi:hypothetical protein
LKCVVTLRFGSFINRCWDDEEGGSPASAATGKYGNTLLKVSYTLAVDFNAEWSFKLETHAFKGFLGVRRAGERGYLTTATTAVKSLIAGTQSATITADLAKGQYVIEAFTAFDVKAAKAAADADANLQGTDGEEPDVVYFRQASQCDLKWTPMMEGALPECGGGSSVQQPLAEPPAAEEEADECDAACNKKQAGLFLSLAFQEEFSNHEENHFMLQGRVTIFILTVEVDITVKPGGAEDGGGIFIWAKATWKIASLLLGEVELTIDVIPIDFESLMSLDFGALEGITFALSLSIKPHVFNVAMEIIEVAVKFLIKLFLIPVLYFIQATQIALEVALEVIEAALKKIREAKRLLTLIEKKTSTRLRFYEVKEKEFADHESEYNKAVVVEEWGDDFCETYERIRSSSCPPAGSDRSDECDEYDIVKEPNDFDCQAYALEKIQQMDKHYAACCTWWQRIKRALSWILLNMQKILVIIVLAIPKALLALIEFVLVVAQAVVKALQFLIEIVVMALGTAFGMPKEKYFNRKNRVAIPKFERYLNALVMLRVYELTVKMVFTPEKLTFAAGVDMVFFSWPIVFELSFSFDIGALISAFKEWAMTTFKELFMGSTDTDKMKEEAAAKDESAAAFLGNRGTRTALASQWFHPEQYEMHGYQSESSHETAWREVRAAALSLGPGGGATEGSAVAEMGVWSVDHDGDEALVDSDAKLAKTSRMDHRHHASLLGHFAAAAQLGSASQAVRDNLRAHLGWEPLQSVVPQLGGKKTPTATACDAVALAVAETCDAAVTKHAAAADMCAMSTSAAHAHGCSSSQIRAATDTMIASLGCDKACGGALHVVGRACGGIVQRSLVSDASRSEACSRGVAAAQLSCRGSPTCASTLAATLPLVHPDEPQHAHWSDQCVGGVIPEDICAAKGSGFLGHLDVRGNRLVGTLPACVWRGRVGTGAVFVARNRLTGALGPLGKGVHKVLASDNMFEGDIAAATRPAANGLETLDVSHNRLTGRLEDMAAMPRLSTLDVSHNNLTERVPGSAMSALRINAPNLRHYDVSGNGLSTPRQPLGSSTAAGVVHLTLVVRRDVAAFCPMCASSAVQHGDCYAAGCAGVAVKDYVPYAPSSSNDHEHKNGGSSSDKKEAHYEATLDVDDEEAAAEATATHGVEDMHAKYAAALGIDVPKPRRDLIKSLHCVVANALQDAGVSATSVRWGACTSCILHTLNPVQVDSRTS